MEAKSLAASGNRTYFARMTELNHRATRRVSWAAVSCACRALLIGVPSRAENWPQWHGPYFNGSSTEKDLLAEWSKTENVAWVAPLPGYSGATPAVWEDSVFVSSPDEQKNLLLICLDRRTGKVRWQKVVGLGNREKGRNNMASPSPATDGKLATSSTSLPPSAWASPRCGRRLRWRTENCSSARRRICIASGTQAAANLDRR